MFYYYQSIYRDWAGQVGDAAMPAELRTAGITATAVAADIGVPVEMERIIDQVEQELGPVTTLVNNAGVLIGKRIEELSLEEWGRHAEPAGYPAQ